MQVEKTSSINFKSALPKQAEVTQNQLRPAGVNRTHSQSFGNISGMMDMIDRGGLVASFLIQDFFGLNIPRSITGLYRNKDITGEYNYQEATEVALRECISGPILFATPMAMLYGIKRLWGKANDVPVKVLNVLGKNFSEHASTKTAQQLADPKEMKKSFYLDTFKNIFKNTYSAKTDESVINETAERFTKNLLEYENLVDNKKTKGFMDKLKGRRVQGTAEDKLADMVAEFAEIKKAHTDNPSANFMSAKMTAGEDEVAKPLGKLVRDMRNFIEDAGESVAKQAEKGVSGENIKQYLKKFTEVRAGSRALVNASMIIGTIIASSFVPKIYQLSENNPGTDGLHPTKDKAEKAENKVDKNAKTQNKNDKSKKSKQVAFGGFVDSLGKKVTQKKGFLSKLTDEFEFDSYGVSFTGLLTVCGLGTLVPRLLTARDENEYKEILLRDTITIGAIAGAAKIFQQIVARACTKASGLALAIKPDGVKNNVFSKAWSYLRPVTGHSVLTNDQLTTKYSNIDKYKGGAAGFAQFIHDQGGDIKKAFSHDEEAHGLLKGLYSKSKQATEVAFKDAQNDDIIKALKDVIANNKDETALDKLYKIFKSDKNKILEKAKSLNSNFNFAVLFLVVPLLLGYVIPAFNESLTKKRELSKNEPNKDDKTSKDKTNNVGVVSTAQSKPVISVPVSSKANSYKRNSSEHDPFETFSKMIEK